jgi:hypothetical protein
MEDRNMVDVISTYIVDTGHDCVLYMKPGAHKPNVLWWRTILMWDCTHPMGHDHSCQLYVPWDG